MKITNLALVFVMLIIPFVVKSYIHAEAREEISYHQVLLNRMIDGAVEDGMDELIVRGNYNEVIIDQKACVRAFFETLYLNLGVENSLTGQRKVDLYVPVVVIVDENGFYTYTLETYTTNSVKEMKHIWSDKIPFAWMEGDLLYLFGIGEEAKVYNVETEEMWQGTFEVLSDIEGFAFLSKTAFALKKKEIMVELLMAAINQGINRHNEIGLRYGMTYQFRMPVIEDDQWNQCIEDVSFLAFVQGIPLGIDGAYFNQFALGGAMIKKATPYYLQENPASWLHVHKEGCPLLTDYERPVRSREEGASEGALPCQHCRP